MCRRLLGVLGCAVLCLSSVGCFYQETYPLQGPWPAMAYDKDEAHFCALHDRRLKVGRAWVYYGEPYLTKDARETRITTYPNAWTWVYSRYRILIDPPRYCYVWYCTDCRTVRSQRYKQSPDAEEFRIHREPIKAGLPTDTRYLGRFTLEQMDDERIECCLDELRLRTCDPEKPEEVRLATRAYLLAIRKLESGWAGFSGEIVGWRGKEPLRRTEKDVLKSEYRMLSAQLARKNPALRRELFVQLCPHAADRELRKEWLHWTILDPVHSFASFEPYTASEQRGRDTAGREYVEVWGRDLGQPARRITTTGPNGKPLVIQTFMIDEKLAPAPDIIDLYLAEIAGIDTRSLQYMIEPKFVSR